MLGGDWLSNPAAGRWLIAVALLVFTATLCIESYTRGLYQSVGEAAVDQQGGSQPPDTLSSRIAALQRQDESPRAGSPCEENAKSVETDLCQQWRMAQAAKEQIRLLTRQNDLAAAQNALSARQNDLTYAQVWVTVAETLFLLLTLGATALAAIAARDSVRVAERALTELERPFVYAVVTRPGIAWGHNEAGTRQLRFGDLELSIFNYGRTPANLTRLAYRIRTATRGSIARPMDPHTFGGRGLPVGTVVVADKPFLEEDRLTFRFNFDEIERLEIGARSVWLVGFVRYDDVFGNSHITGFAEVFDRMASRFVRRGDDQYNYARKERREDIPPEADDHDDRADLPPEA